MSIARDASSQHRPILMHVALGEVLLPSQEKSTSNSKVKLDPRTMFATADQFWNGAKILLEGVTARGDQAAWVAALTCEALALELYFKCLAVQEGKDAPAIHNLLRLFKVLNGKTQNEIRNKSEPLIAAAAKRLGASHDFDKALEASRDAFETIRYIYEGVGPGEAWMCSGVMRVTRTLILERNPSWDPSYIQLPSDLRVVIHDI